jgi:hypothetical protein
MKKTSLFIMAMICLISLNAQKKVAYVTQTKTMDATATTIANDPIIQLLKADPNFTVTVKELASTAAANSITDLADYDLIIIQEGFSSSATILRPGGSLAFSTLPKPTIHNKPNAFKPDAAFYTGTTPGTAAAWALYGSNAETLDLNITVAAGKNSNDLFKACTIDANNQIKLLNSNSNAAGLTTATGALKGMAQIKYNNGSFASTLLARPSSITDATLSVNDIPANTTIEGVTVPQRIITMCLNIGPLCATAGRNITDDGLTIWRNAAYILTGLPVPTTKATFPTGINKLDFTSKVVSEEYFTLNGVKIKEPVKGIYLKKSSYENGSVKFDKVVLANPFLK